MVSEKNKNSKILLPKEIIEEYNKEINSKVKGFNVRMDDDGILRVSLKKEGTDNEVMGSLKTMHGKFKEIGRKSKGKLKILADLNPAPHFSSLNIRRKYIEIIKDVDKDPGFEKIAIWGGKTVQRVVASFVIATSRRKNIKLFKTEEEALKWLKED